MAESKRPSNNRRKPARYALQNCSSRCTLNPDNLPPGIAQMVHSWYERGDSKVEMSKQSDLVGHHLSEGAIGNHLLKHLVKIQPPPPHAAEPVKRKSDLDILDQIIGRGSEMVDLATFRITAEQLLRAIELKQKLTQGSMFQDFFGAIEEESDRLAAAEAEDAERSKDEQEQAGSDDAQPE